MDIISRTLDDFKNLKITDAIEVFQKKRDEFQFVYQYPPSVTLGTHDGSWKLTNVPKELGIYVHIPFCPTRCTFCHYYRITKPGEDVIEKYISTLCAEIALWEKEAKDIGSSLKNSKVNAIYLGGGTPTYLSKSQLNMVLKTIRNYFSVTEDAEICIEATPDTLGEDMLSSIKELGFNRISIGIQTFNDDILKKLNRNHDAETAKKVIIEAKKIATVNVDLLFGLPRQKPLDWLDDLEEIKKLSPDFITTFLTRIKQNTPLSKIPLSEFPEQAETLFMHLLSMEALNEYHLIHDIQWAKKDNFTFQQLKWQNNEFIGLGPSSYSYINGLVCNNFPKLSDYTDAIKNGKLPIGASSLLDAKEKFHRAVVLGLKMASGLNVSELHDTYGFNANDVFKDEFLLLEKNEFIKRDNDLIKPTKKGLLFINEICEMFFSDGVKKRMQSAVDSGIEAHSICENWED